MESQNTRAGSQGKTKQIYCGFQGMLEEAMAETVLMEAALMGEAEILQVSN